ncbi:hypothetical protein G3I40_20460 [Streptomyces sp. SID14478]|uniref:hypothetical protein n=1 Tax=Streptomyces sp. SID14478 TaxID=2706073 RepID=UPI0013DA974B|nr:hypothetical protein [Streptomyces sp. SID14478]NEB77572.1 hypothetical protein [Streptomyces sp. SID14478]
MSLPARLRTFAIRSPTHPRIDQDSVRADGLARRNGGPGKADRELLGMLAWHVQVPFAGVDTPTVTALRIGLLTG